MKKAIILAVCLTLSFGIFGSSASARSYTVSNNFKTSWEKKVTVNQTGYFKYGFNTTAIDEDYVHTWHPASKINANLKNANGTFTAKWSVVYMRYGADVRHSGNTVTYTYY